MDLQQFYKDLNDTWWYLSRYTEEPYDDHNRREEAKTTIIDLQRVIEYMMEMKDAQAEEEELEE